MSTQVHIDALVKEYGTLRALDGISIDIQSGAWVALMGPSGSGKTTLINILGGELHPDAGEILVGGKQVSWRDPHHAATNGISVVHQELSLCLNLTVLENIGLARAANSRAWQLVDRGRMREDANLLLSSFGFPSDDLNKPVHRLSLFRSRAAASGWTGAPAPWKSRTARLRAIHPKSPWRREFLSSRDAARYCAKRMGRR